MAKKRFNTNIEEDKLIALKKLALEEGIGANDMIEKLVDMYLERHDKRNQSAMNLSTKLDEEVLDKLRKQGLNLEKYKVLLVQKWMYTYKEEHFRKFGIYREENIEIHVKDVETQKIYIVRYNFIKTTKTERTIEELCYVECRDEKSAILESLEYVYFEKYEYEKEILLDEVKIKLMPNLENPNYRLEHVLLYNI